MHALRSFVSQNPALLTEKCESALMAGMLLSFFGGFIFFYRPFI
jgi:hypothetical protein